MSEEVTEYKTHNQEIIYPASVEVISNLKKESTGLVIDGVKDTKGYEAVRVARGNVRSLRIDVESKRKELTRDSIDYQKKVNQEAKRLTGLLLEVEEPLAEKLDAINKEKAKIKAQKEAELLAVYNNRISRLIEIGATLSTDEIYISSSLCDAKISVEISSIKKCDDFLFAGIFEDFNNVSSEIQKAVEEAERVAKEESERAEAARSKKEAEEAEARIALEKELEEARAKNRTIIEEAERVAKDAEEKRMQSQIENDERLKKLQEENERLAKEKKEKEDQARAEIQAKEALEESERKKKVEDELAASSAIEKQAQIDDGVKYSELIDRTLKTLTNVQNELTSLDLSSLLFSQTRDDLIGKVEEAIQIIGIE